MKNLGIQTRIDDDLKKIDSEQSHLMLKVSGFNEAMKRSSEKPDPVMLFPHLLSEGSNALLFGGTALGKTVFGVQMADAVARTGRKTAYGDFELSDKQQERRIKNEKGELYSFSENLFRFGFTETGFGYSGQERLEYFKQSIISIHKTLGVEVFFIDNLTSLVAGDTDTAKDTINVMLLLKSIKEEYNLTILLMDHSKKVLDWQPISLNDLQGSKMKSNFADEIFAIGASKKGSNVRYIKQLKCRDRERIYDENNVLEMILTKEDGFLSFKENGTCPEVDHLTNVDYRGSEQKEAAAALRAEGKSNVEIARILGKSEGAIRKWFKSS